MNKYIVLSVNDNPDYLYFAPLTCWAWRQFGWEPIMMYHGDEKKLEWISDFPGSDIIAPIVNSIEGYRSDTITQVSRLYASAAFPWKQLMGKTFLDKDCYLMTGDIDMVPLSDYWQPDFEKITVWGHDLTGYGHYPICYIGMHLLRWMEVMKINSSSVQENMKRDLDSLPQAKSPDFYKYWFSDQDLITERLKPYNPVHVLRGQYPNGYACGRVDRGAWSLAHSQFIDAHLPQQVYHKGRERYFEQMMELLHHVWPKEDFGWLYNYTVDFKKLTGHV